MFKKNIFVKIIVGLSLLGLIVAGFPFGQIMEEYGDKKEINNQTKQSVILLNECIVKNGIFQEDNLKKIVETMYIENINIKAETLGLLLVKSIESKCEKEFKVNTIYKNNLLKSIKEMSQNINNKLNQVKPKEKPFVLKSLNPKEKE